MKRILTVILLALLLPVPAIRAQGADALPFTRIERDPANAALAGAGAAYAGSATWKAFSDAATLPFYAGSMDAALAYQRYAPGAAPSNNIQLGAAYKLGSSMAFSLGYALDAGQSYPELGPYGQPVGTVSPKAHLLALGAGMSIGEQLSLGVNLRYALQKGTDTYSGVSADVSVAWQPVEQVRVTAGVATLGTNLTSMDGSQYKQPASARIGAWYGLPLGQDQQLDAMLSGDVFFSGQYAAALGLQYAWRNMIYARCGYRLASEYCVLPSHLGIGLGAKYANFSLDLTWLTASKALGNTLAVGLGYSF